MIMLVLSGQPISNGTLAGQNTNIVTLANSLTMKINMVLGHPGSVDRVSGKHHGGL